MDKKNLTIRLFFYCLFYVISLLPASVYGSPCVPGQLCTSSLVWQNKLRTFHFFLPASDIPKQNNQPLIIVLHDSENNGLTFQKNILQGNFETEANRQGGGIIVYPDAVGQAWDYSPNSKAKAIDDVGFIRQLISYFIKTYHTNPNRTYVAGMATGGMLAYRLACESADKITAVATVLAAMPITLAKTCAPVRPISILMINAGYDTLLLPTSNKMYEAPGKLGAPRLTISQTFSKWIALNHIHNKLLYSSLPAYTGDGTWVTKETAQNQQTEVTWYIIVGAGHYWPGGNYNLSAPYPGKNSYNLNATAKIWRFFNIRTT